MTSRLRFIVAVVSGAVVAFGVTAGVETIGHTVYPVPPGLDFKNSEALADYVRQLPIGALMFVLAASAIATFLGALLAARIARANGARAARVVGLMVLAASLTNFFRIPHPIWFMAATVIVIPLASTLAGLITVKQWRG